MNIKIFALDDSHAARFLIEYNFKSFNENNSDGVTVDLKTFETPEEFLLNMTQDVDLCLLDIDLGHDDMDGFDVAREVHDKYKNANFIISSYCIDDDEDCESYIPKAKTLNFASEVVAKYLNIKVNKILNFAELLFRQDHYRCHGS